MVDQNRIHIRRPDRTRDDDRESFYTDAQAHPMSEKALGDVETTLGGSTSSAQNHGQSSVVSEPRNFGAVPPGTVEEDVTSSIAAQPAAKPASAKFASCDDGAVQDNERAAPTAEAHDASLNEDASTSSARPSEPDMPLAKTALELAIDRLTALGEQSDKMVNEKWAKRAAPILKESLSFLSAYEAASEAEQKAVRKSLKAKSGVSREPNVDNLPVIAVYMGVHCSGEKRTKAQRKEWCRFATVVKVAARASIKPEDAAEWLEKKTLNGILAEWRDIQKAAGKGTRKSAVPKVLDNYTHLTAALAKGSRFLALAKSELAKADAAVGKVMSDMTKAAAVAAASDLPAEKVAVNV